MEELKLRDPTLAKKIIEKIEALTPDYPVKFCHVCFPPGTPILMRDLTEKPIERVQVGDVVECHTSHGRVIAITSRYYHGYIYEIKAEGCLPIYATPDHPFLIKTRTRRELKWQKARYIGHRTYLVCPIPTEIEDVKMIDVLNYIKFNGETFHQKRRSRLKEKYSHNSIPRHIPVTSGLLRLIGYYLAEGDIIQYKDRPNPSGIRFIFGQKDEQHAMKVKRYIRDIFGLSCLWLERGHTITIEVRNRTLAKLFEALCGKYAEGKRLHPILMKLPLKRQLCILDAYFAGDGHRRKRHKQCKPTYMRATTVSGTLANQVWIILHRLKKKPAIYVEPEHVDKNGVYHKTCYRVVFSEQGKGSLARFYEGDWLFTPVKSKIRRWYSGLVYNLEVEGYNSYIANKVAVHNCGTHEYVVTHFGLRSLLPKNIEVIAGPGCVTPDTHVLLEGNRFASMEELAKVWENEEVVSCDWLDKEIHASGLLRYMKLNPDDRNLKVFEVTAKETDRRIVATEDHPFFVKDAGKIPLKDLKKGDFVAIYPTKPLKLEPSHTNFVILDEKSIEEHLLPNSHLEYIKSKLRSKGLLPLTTKNRKLPVLARLLGHLFGDGYLTYSRKGRKYDVEIGFTGTISDLEEIRLDLSEIGFDANEEAIHTRFSRSIIHKDGKEHMIKGHTTTLCCNSKPLWILLKVLGAPVGDKAKVRYRVPSWIRSSPLRIQREFVAAYFGSELRKPTINRARGGKQFINPSFSLHKVSDLVDNGLEFILDIEEILKNFGVRLTRVGKKFRTKRRSGERAVEITAYISNSTESLLNLYGTIGYVYCKKRDALARYAFEYLLMKDAYRRKRYKVAKKAFELRNKGYSLKEIVKELQSDCVRKHDVKAWLSRDVDIANIRLPLSFPTFDEWRESATEGLRDSGLVWEKVEHIKEVKASDVRDMTTFSISHNFIANGFLVGNCPVCIVPSREIDEAIWLAEHGKVLLTFGDMYRVPGSYKSLADAKALGGDVRIVYSVSDAVEIARKEPEKELVFFAIGFETTAPTTAFEILKGIPPNMSFLISHRLIPPAMELLLGIGDLKIDGFICPGHVATVIGAKSFRIFPETYRMPTVIAGFEPIDFLISILMLLRQLKSKTVRLDNEYVRSVTEKGNIEAQKLIERVFDITSGDWRGIGRLPSSAYKLKEEFSEYDTRLRYDIKVGPSRDIHPGCNCHLVIIGKIQPTECPLFMKTCRPEHPMGPCMVSREGTCQIWSRYRVPEWLWL